ncbi:response regulator [Arcobacteraceae bacterium]|nr:response regulator [Arcobacteraceae bacterium]
MLEEFTLLYVEDDVEMQEYMASLLKDEVKFFYKAYNGEEGLNIFNTKKPDIIISDIEMPLLDGLDMSKQIKVINPDQIIILLSSLNDIKVIKDSIDINIDGYINKPIIDIHDFINKIYSKVTILKYKNLKRKEEKLELLLDVIQEVSHHWRQPLNVISLISSEHTYKYENQIEINEEDIEKLKLITSTVQNLSTVLDKIENITLQGDDIENLSDIIQISNPIYKN